VTFDIRFRKWWIVLRIDETLGIVEDRSNQRKTILSIGRVLKLIESQRNTTRAKILVDRHHLDYLDMERLDGLYRDAKNLLLHYKDYVLPVDDEKRPA
jgi:hypothetical protein